MWTYDENVQIHKCNMKTFCPKRLHWTIKYSLISNKSLELWQNETAIHRCEGYMYNRHLCKHCFVERYVDRNSQIACEREYIFMMLYLIWTIKVIHMYVLNVSLSIYSYIITLKQIISEDKGDLKQTNKLWIFTCHLNHKPLP